MYKIMIAGCGELGSRFLQAAVRVPGISEIDIIEPSEKARGVAAKRAQEMMSDPASLQLNWFDGFSNALSSGNMAVIATQADTRLTVFERLLGIGYRNFLVEKIVTQSDPDYRRMMELAEEHGAKVWVNCKTRTYPVWEYIRSKISPGGKLIYHSVGGNQGLCTIGVHIIDLFVYLTNASELKVVSTRFDPAPYLTKRGKYDVSGSMELQNDPDGSSLFIQYDSAHTQWPTELLTTADHRWMVDNSTRQAFESGPGQRKWTPLPFEGDLSVSFMSIAFISDILTKNSCQLPTLQECYAAHRVVFEAMLPYFNRTLGKNDPICPIT